MEEICKLTLIILYIVVSLANFLLNSRLVRSNNCNILGVTGIIYQTEPSFTYDRFKFIDVDIYVRIPLIYNTWT